MGLALATTTVHVATEPDDPDRDDHDSPLPADPVDRGPFPAHRAPFSSRVRSATKTAADGSQTRLSTWYLDPAAWPVHVGDVITDDNDATTKWVVAQAELVPSGLGLDQVSAACSMLDTSAT